MNEKLSSLISELGGKHGGLEHLRDNPNIARWVVPNVVLSHRDAYTQVSDQALRKLCDRFNTNQIIVRTSEQSDWDCMVDTMPTREGTLNDVARIVDQVREECHADSLLEYASIAGNGYDPKKVSVSVAPKFRTPLYTLTEHPNQRNTLLLDALHYHGEDIGWLTDMVDIIDYRAIDLKFQIRTGAISERNSLNAPFLVGYARSSNSFDKDDALQFEFVNQPRTDDLPFITQVRWFARKRIEDFHIEEVSSYYKSNRIFGIAKETDSSLPIARGYDRMDAMRTGENLERPYALSPQNIRPQLTHAENPPTMKSYIAGETFGMEALCHNNTRFIQMCLRRGGIAVLDKMACFILESKVELGLVTNGTQYNIPYKTE